MKKERSELLCNGVEAKKWKVYHMRAKCLQNVDKHKLFHGCGGGIQFAILRAVRRGMRVVGDQVALPLIPFFHVFSVEALEIRLTTKLFTFTMIDFPHRGKFLFLIHFA
jgi:hypothetical protein